MKKSLLNAWSSLLKLARLVIWYGVVVAVLFYLLPLLGVLVEEQYDAIVNSAKFLAIIGFFGVVAAWQVRSAKDRMN